MYKVLEKFYLVSFVKKFPTPVCIHIKARPQVKYRYFERKRKDKGRQLQILGEGKYF